jgi:hypothetical protein
MSWALQHIIEVEIVHCGPAIFLYLHFPHCSLSLSLSLSLSFTLLISLANGVPQDSVVSGGDGVGGGREWEGADDEEDAEEGIGGGRDEWTQSRRVLRQEG